MPRVKTATKEQAILDAASQVFALRPFHEVLIDDIAADASIGKGTIYRYFPTKEDLYFATILHGLDTLAEIRFPQAVFLQTLRSRCSGADRARRS